MDEIIHKGIVINCDKNIVELKIIDNINCSSCSMKNACITSEAKNNNLFVEVNNTVFRKGETVKIYLSEKLAFSAVVWGYIFPFLILLTSVIILSFYFSDAITGGISLLFLALYYLGVYYNQSYFSKKFNFKIKSIIHE